MNIKPTLLIVEDEPSILRGLTDLFTFHGFEVDSEMDGKKGLNRAVEGQYTCIILDVMLPSMNGFEICNAIRQQSQVQPILMLTAKNTEEDIINGLTLGADDYVAKPFSASELILRVTALIRRSGLLSNDNKLNIGDHISICMQKLTGTSYGQEVRYTRREVTLLSYLNQQKSSVSRDELLREIWGYKSTEHIDTRTVDIHIAKIRKKIERDSKTPVHLVTLRGEGYQLFSAQS
ncbi:DNA-binding response regulator [Pseudoalteromonas citrea]|uniref:DNA-binding response regulator n=1 Tax=Pseudoalteromonas citrea TaxID=43655 RepID=A0A5S3XN12_9GAMM|nr:response regulator transcription factor [Pseudoalteromonas citrea]TMP47158.1 DNA-binding response regulator [Pseudoalteromonas citrea]TMP58089.1 DNA-binding response regulator [Pseudoalteromonas citrea]